MDTTSNKKQSFDELLINLMLPIREFMEFTREQELSTTLNEGRVDFDEDTKAGFKITAQYDRPIEYLQALLDIVRVEFDPNPLGTFQLNSNLGFILNSIPGNDFYLGYISISSQQGQSFHDFWKYNAVPYISKCGYDLYQTSALFAVVTTGKERHGGQLMGEVQEVLGSGFSVDEVLGSFARASVCNNDLLDLKSSSSTYAGFCCDPSLDNKLRLSVWLFVKKNINYQ